MRIFGFDIAMPPFVPLPTALGAISTQSAPPKSEGQGWRRLRGPRRFLYLANRLQMGGERRPAKRQPKNDRERRNERSSA